MCVESDSIMNHFSIKDVEALTGIKPHTLRIWEQRYGIPQPKRTSTNIRYYDDEDVKLLLNVAMLNRQGHKISSITKMTKPEMDRLVLDMSLHSDDYMIQIEALTAAMFVLDEVAFEKILASNILQSGLDNTFLNIVFPFLARVGVLWQTGSINPAYEHFISNLIRQKLFVAIDGQSRKQNVDSKKFILFLPEHEPHELGLLFANYLIRSRGFHTNYLGPNLPMEELTPVMNLYKADFILTVLTSGGQLTPLQVANKLAASFPKAQILLAGSQGIQPHIQLPKNVRYLRTFDDLVQLLEMESARTA